MDVSSLVSFFGKPLSFLVKPLSFLVNASGIISTTQGLAQFGNGLFFSYKLVERVIKIIGFHRGESILTRFTSYDLSKPLAFLNCASCVNRVYQSVKGPEPSGSPDLKRTSGFEWTNLPKLFQKSGIELFIICKFLVLSPYCNVLPDLLLGTSYLIKAYLSLQKNLNLVHDRERWFGQRIYEIHWLGVFAEHCRDLQRILRHIEPDTDENLRSLERFRQEFRTLADALPNSDLNAVVQPEPPKSNGTSVDMHTFPILVNPLITSMRNELFNNQKKIIAKKENSPNSTASNDSQKPIIFDPIIFDPVFIPTSWNQSTLDDISERMNILKNLQVHEERRAIKAYSLAILLEMIKSINESLKKTTGNENQNNKLYSLFKALEDEHRNKVEFFLRVEHRAQLKNYKIDELKLNEINLEQMKTVRLIEDINFRLIECERLINLFYSKNAQPSLVQPPTLPPPEDREAKTSYLRLINSAILTIHESMKQLCLVYNLENKQMLMDELTWLINKSILRTRLAPENKEKNITIAITRFAREMLTKLQQVFNGEIPFDDSGSQNFRYQVVGFPKKQGSYSTEKSGGKIVETFLKLAEQLKTDNPKQNTSSAPFGELLLELVQAVEKLPISVYRAVIKGTKEGEQMLDDIRRIKKVLELLKENNESQQKSLLEFLEKERQDLDKQYGSNKAIEKYPIPTGRACVGIGIFLARIAKYGNWLMSNSKYDFFVDSIFLTDLIKRTMMGIFSKAIKSTWK